MSGDLSLAEDAAQDACEAALAQWPREGLPASPRAWLAAVARRRAVDQLRREVARPAKEQLAARAWAVPPGDGGLEAAVMDRLTDSSTGHTDDDEQLALLFACCHPSLDAPSRTALTLRCVCGVPTAAIARLLVLPEPTVAQRLVRAKRKVRDAGIRLRVPSDEERPARLASVLRVVYLLFTEGHFPGEGSMVVRSELCDEALHLARHLHRLLPGDPQVCGLLALFLLTSAREHARASASGALVPLAEQNRSHWDRDRIDDGLSLLADALSLGRPGPYQIQAAIAACHAEARTPADTDWRQIAALYGELLRFDPSPVVVANRAVAVAHAEGPAAGLAILDALVLGRRLAGWPQLHIARAELLAQSDRADEALAEYDVALALEPAEPVRRFIRDRLARITTSSRE